jgi:hypothetical protein
MKSRKTVLSLLAAGCTVIAGGLAYLHWSAKDLVGARAELLELLPGDPNAVIFVDVGQLRASPFLVQLFAWAPQPTPDADYEHFVKATGFHYEQDLERAAIAVMRPANIASYVVIAEGHFDRQKIEAYAGNAGKREAIRGRTIYALHASGSSGNSFFTFLRDDRIAWTNDLNYAGILLQPTASASPGEWREHFTRLAGVPVFAVLRQDSGSLVPLAQQAPGGLKSPQLAALLAQLQWISIAGKPDGNLLRVVIDGECLSEQTVKQLHDFLNGVVMLAQIGLNDAKTRRQLDPQLREAYLELLQSAEIEKMDRGSSKSVRVVLEVTPKLLEAARKAAPVAEVGAPKTMGP